MKIRTSNTEDLVSILSVHREAFGTGTDEQGQEGEGKVIADLVNDLFNDHTAKPFYSIVAEEQGEIIGHVIFTKVVISNHEQDIKAQILAPLAVKPEFQSQGTGQTMVNQGLELLKDSGVDLVFVLGYPDYYSRFGFITASKEGFEASYPIATKNDDAWMILKLSDKTNNPIKGKVMCCKALDKPEYWVE